MAKFHRFRCLQSITSDVVIGGAEVVLDGMELDTECIVTGSLQNELSENVLFGILLGILLFGRQCHFGMDHGSDSEIRRETESGEH